MLSLLVKLPDGKMTVRRESEASGMQLHEGARYIMPDGKEGVVVQPLGGPYDYDLVSGLIDEISSMVLMRDGASKDAMEVLGRLLNEVRFHAEVAERNKCAEEKATLLKDKVQRLENYNPTGERLVKNLSRCVDAIRKLRAENEKLRRKHKRATLRIQALMEFLYEAIASAKAEELDAATGEAKAVPPENPNPQPAPSSPDPKSVETE